MNNKGLRFSGKRNKLNQKNKRPKPKTRVFLLFLEKNWNSFNPFLFG